MTAAKARANVESPLILAGDASELLGDDPDGQKGLARPITSEIVYRFTWAVSRDRTNDLHHVVPARIPFGLYEPPALVAAPAALDELGCKHDGRECYRNRE